MNVSSGGFAILVVGAIWFLVFLPSFIKGENRKEVKTLESNVRDTVETKLGERASAALKLKRGRNILAGLTLVSLLVAGLSVAEIVIQGTGLAVVTVSAGLFVAGSWLTIRINRNFKLAAAGSMRRQVPLNSATTKVPKQPEPQSEAVWQPNKLPDQTFLRTGAIEIVELAEVVSLTESKTSKEIDGIDEILRRRRHTG